MVQHTPPQLNSALNIAAELSISELGLHLTVKQYQWSSQEPQQGQGDRQKHIQQLHSSLKLWKDTWDTLDPEDLI